MHTPREIIFGPWRAVLVLGVTQILAWGVLFYPPVLTVPLIAAERGWSMTFAMGGLSLALLTAGVVSPRVGLLIDRHGGHRVMPVGSLLAALGLLLIVYADHPVAYLAVWMLLGVAIAGSLYDPAFATLGRIFGSAARRPITALTLAGGFASTESGEPTHAGLPGGKSLWWEWTPSSTANVRVTTTGSAYDTTLVSLVPPGEETAPLPRVFEEHGIRVIRVPHRLPTGFAPVWNGVFGLLPYTLGRYRNADLPGVLRSVIQETKPRFAMVTPLHMATYVEDLGNTPMVLREHNVEHLWMKRYAERGYVAIDPVILTVGVLRAGTARNIIPDTAYFEATVRAFSPDLEDQLRETFTRCVRGVAAAHGVEADVELRTQYPVTINDAAGAHSTLTALLVVVALAVIIVLPPLGYLLWLTQTEKWSRA